MTFSSVREGREAATKVVEGHVTDVSVGYEVKESYWVPDGERQIINGKEYTGPLKVSTRWEVRELSLVPIGADDLAKVRSMAAGPAGSNPGNSHNRGENTMNICKKCGKEISGELCACGHRQAPTPGGDQGDQGSQSSQGQRGQAATPPAGAAGGQAPEGNQRGQNPAGERGDTPAATAGQINRAAAEAVRAERERISSINEAVTVAGLPETLARQLVDNGITLDHARATIIDELKKRGPGLGAGTASGFEVGLEDGEKFRSAALDGLLLRGGVKIEKPAAGHREFRGMRLLDIARECLERSGVRTRGLSLRELAARAISPNSTSDFPPLMSDLSGKHLLAAYNEAPATWRPWVATTSATDFKDIYGISFSEAPDLLDLDENGEYRTAKFKEKQERYRVSTKGRRIKLTRQMLINDDLRAFTRVNTLFGNAARRMESDAVYSLVVANPKMADNKNLFSADHKNVAAAGSALSSSSLSEGRVTMRRQKGLNGATLDIVPAFLLVPLEEETDAEVLLRSIALPEATMSAGVFNPWAGRLTPVAESRLEGNAWYLVASPTQAPVIEVAWLEGEEQPYVEDEVEFSSDSLVIKVRHDFGAGLVDHVGIYRNEGPAE